MKSAEINSEGGTGLTRLGNQRVTSKGVVVVYKLGLGRRVGLGEVIRDAFYIRSNGYTS